MFGSWKIILALLGLTSALQRVATPNQNEDVRGDDSKIVETPDRIWYKEDFVTNEDGKNNFMLAVEQNKISDLKFDDDVSAELQQQAISYKNTKEVNKKYSAQTNWWPMPEASYTDLMRAILSNDFMRLDQLIRHYIQEKILHDKIKEQRTVQIHVQLPGEDEKRLIEFEDMTVLMLAVATNNIPCATILFHRDIDGFWYLDQEDVELAVRFVEWCGRECVNWNGIDAEMRRFLSWNARFFDIKCNVLRLQNQNMDKIHC